MQAIKNLFAPRDLTQGGVTSGIIAFSIPLLLGNLAQQLYNTVDAVVVGRYIGDDALGAVGLAGSIINLMIVLFMGISTGATIVVSQFFGEKNRAGLTRSVGTIVMITLYTSLLMSVVGALTARPLLMLIGTSGDMLDLAYDYLFVIMIAGSVGGAFYNILSGVLRGLGDSTSPLIYLLITSVLNIILDVLFVTSFGMKTDGVAWATAIAQAVSAVLCLIRLKRMKAVLDFDKSSLKVDKPIASRIIRLGVPAGLTQMIFSLSNIVVQALTVSLGNHVVTAANVVMRVDGFAMMPNFTFGMAATTFTGQNVGARRLDRVREGAKATLIIALCTATVLTTLILIFGADLMRIFTQTHAIVELGYGMMQILAAGYIAFAATQVLMGVMRGAGETVKPMWISVITTVVVRMPIAYLWAYLTRTPASPAGDPVCLYGSLLISWLFGCAATVFVYRRGSWKHKLDWMKDDAPQAQSEGSDT